MYVWLAFVALFVVIGIASGKVESWVARNIARIEEEEDKNG